MIECNRRNRDDAEPDSHDRAKESRHARRAARLGREQQQQNKHRQRHHIGIEGRGDELDTFDRRKHRQRRRDHRITVESRANNSEKNDGAGASVTARCASAIRASVPPSPWLSARSRISTYFSVTTTISAHRIRDTTPSTARD